jgi:Tfp pilus assembly protein PilO
MQIDLKKQITVILIGSLAAALILFFIFVFFFLKGIKQTSADLINIKKESLLFQTKLSGEEDVNENYQKIEPDLTKIENSFVNPEVPIDLIKFWEQTASNSGIYINIAPISSSADDKDKKYAWGFMNFRLSLFGSFEDLLRFLERIEAGPYLIEIKDLSIQKLNSSDLVSKEYPGLSVNDVKAILTLKVFTESK